MTASIFSTTQYSDTEGRMVVRYRLCSGELPPEFTEFVGYFKHTFSPRPGEPGMPFDLSFPIILGNESDRASLRVQAYQDYPGERLDAAFQAFDECRDKYIPVWEEKMREHVEAQIAQAMEGEAQRRKATQAAQRASGTERHVAKGEEDSLIQRG